MLGKDLLPIIRPHPSDTGGLVYAGGIESDGMVMGGTVRSATGETYEIKDGYLDLLKTSAGADSPANLTNFLPGAGRSYEPLWRVRSLSLLTGERFPNERELEIIKRLVRPDRGGRFLDLGCSAGLYTRSLARDLGAGDAVGIDISPSMLREADRRARLSGSETILRPGQREEPSFLRRYFRGSRMRRLPQRVLGPLACPSGDTPRTRTGRPARHHGHPTGGHAARSPTPALHVHGGPQVLRS